jgi:sec-independent protein translocase protein TatC
MPFFDHLEELRWRIIWSLLALIISSMVGFYVAIRFPIIAFLKRPVEPYLPTNELLALAVTDPFFITFKLAVSMGFIAAMPVILYNVWAFLSPALTPREKRAIVPSLYLGLVLFAGGVTLAYFYALPMSL